MRSKIAHWVDLNQVRRNMGALYALSERYLPGFLYERACHPGPLKATGGLRLYSLFL